MKVMLKFEQNKGNNFAMYVCASRCTVVVVVVMAWGLWTVPPPTRPWYLRSPP